MRVSASTMPLVNYICIKLQKLQGKREFQSETLGGGTVCTWASVLLKENSLQLTIYLFYFEDIFLQMGSEKITFSQYRNSTCKNFNLNHSLKIESIQWMSPSKIVVCVISISSVILTQTKSNSTPSSHRFSLKNFAERKR